MSSTLVYRYKQILRLVSKGPVGSNRIVQHTSVTWSSPIFKMIIDLAKAGLITREKHRKHGQRILNELTPLGKEVLYLIEVIDAYEAAISKLDQAINEKILIIEEGHLSMLNGLQGLLYKIAMQDQNNPITTTGTAITENEVANKRRLYEYRLKELGWSEKQIEFYNECRLNAINFKIFCDQYYEYILLLRYASIINIIGSRTNINKSAQKIINSIIQDAINKRVIYNMRNIRKHTLGYDVLFTDVSARRTCLISKRVGGTEDIFGSLYKILTWHPIPHVIYNEVKDILMVYLALLKPYTVDLENDILQTDLYTSQQPAGRMLMDEQRFPIMVDNVDSYGKKESESKVKAKSKPEPIPVSPEDRMKVSRYRALLQESKEFIDSICGEYCNQNVERIKHIKNEISYEKLSWYYCIGQTIQSS